MPGSSRLHPQGDLAQLDRHRVDVHAVDAVADHVAQGGADHLGRRLVVAGAHAAPAAWPGDAPRRSGSARCRRLGRTLSAPAAPRSALRGCARLAACDGLARPPDRAPNRAGPRSGGRRVVAAGGLALVAAGGDQLEGAARRC